MVVMVVVVIPRFPPQPSLRTQNPPGARKVATHLVLAVTVATCGTASHFECGNEVTGTSCELVVGCRLVSRDRRERKEKGQRVTGLFDFQAVQWQKALSPSNRANHVPRRADQLSHRLAIGA
jgi:hypothetical protein